MKIEEGYSESNATKSECFGAEILESEQNMEFSERLYMRRNSGKKLSLFRSFELISPDIHPETEGVHIAVPRVRPQCVTTHIAGIKRTFTDQISP